MLGHINTGGIKMSQKELNYIEDVYNHEKLIIEILKASKESVEDENYVELFENQINKHTDLIANIEKCMGDIYE